MSIEIVKEDSQGKLDKDDKGGDDRESKTRLYKTYGGKYIAFL